MQSERYKGYDVWGHAIREQSDIVVEHERYAASGTVTKAGKFVEASSILGIADTEEEAQEIGLQWARAWVDNHT